MKFDKLYMMKMLDNCYPASGLSNIPKSSLDYTNQTNGDWTPILDALIEWRDKGWLIIIKDPRYANEEDICVRMLTFMGGEKFPDFWIRDLNK